MPALELKCTIKKKYHLTPTVFTLVFEANQALEYKAGHFMSIIIPGAGPGGRNLRRAYSIASVPHAPQLELCIKLVEKGPGTQYLYSLKEGDDFQAAAPYGNFLYVTPPSRHVVFLATGTGLSPFRSMIFSESYQAQPPQSTTVLFGAASQEEILYEEEFTSSSLVKWVPCISRDQNWNGFQGRLTDYLRQSIDKIDWPNTDFYLCGNGSMITEAKGILAEQNVLKEHIHQEKYY